jgi:hypothetical protein
MTDSTKGMLFIIGGCLLSVVALNLLIEIVLLCTGLWMIDRGMRLRQIEPLFEKIRRIVNAL